MFNLDTGNIEVLLGITAGAAALAAMLIVLALVDLARTRRHVRGTVRPAVAEAGSQPVPQAAGSLVEPEAA